MDDLEFRTRAFSNPRDEDPDFLDACRSSSEREHFLKELHSLENSINDTLHTVAVPEGLADRLKQHARSDSGDMGDRGDTAHGDMPDARTGGRVSRLPHIAIAASLGLAVGLSLMLSGGSELSARDLAFHDELIAHLYQEETGYNSSSVDWDEVTRVVTSSGGTFHQEMVPLKDHSIRFANNCHFNESADVAHLVMQGERGPVSVIYTSNTPVNEVITLRDERFEGRIIPMENGNLTIAGEKEEVLAPYESAVTDSIAWSI